MPDWPVEIAPTIAAFENARGTKLTLREELSGKSGAFVAIADATGKRDGVFVLKIASKPDGYEDEAQLHEQVVASGAFSGRTARLVDLIYHDNFSLALIEPSGKSFLECRPLLEATPLFGATYEALVSALWTPNTFVIGDYLDLAELIRAALPYQLSESAGGRIFSNVRAHVSEVPSGADQFAVDDRLLPNPIYFISDQRGYPLPRVRPLFGPTHGDCHPGNILIRASVSSEVRELYLIDFASYRPSAPIFFDFAYLELSTLLRHFEGAGDASWWSLVTRIASDSASKEPLPHELRAWVEDIQRGRREIYRLMESTYALRVDDLRLQFDAMGVAVGLAFLNKLPRVTGSVGLSASQFRKAFVWAAVHLDMLIRRGGIAVSSQAEVVPRLGAAHVRHTLEAVEWQLFSTADLGTLNVLILGSGVRDKLESALSLLNGSWNVVIDFATTELSEDIETVLARSVRQVWPGGARPDVKLLARGVLWYFANGRGDLTDVTPSTSSTEWRRRYIRALDDLLEAIAVDVSPTVVRVLFVGLGMDESTARMIVESLDTAFGDALQRVVVAEMPVIHTTIDSSTLRYTSFNEASVELASRRIVAVRSDEVHVPQRTDTGAVLLVPLPESAQLRVSKDLTVVSAARAAVMTAGRSFGIDFRRGMRIEWAELAQNIDVIRPQWQKLYQDRVVQHLEKTPSTTVQLLHEPSSGGTTIGRRIAWELKERYPVVSLEQLTADTAGYIRELFQFANLPVLVLMESDVVTESARDGLFKQLREDNTRAVFLWVSRVYDSALLKDVIPSRLTRDEADAFRDAYLAVTDDADRRSALEQLTRSPEFAEQRSPFFFGLTAFGEGYISLANLIQHTVRPLDATRRQVVADLALVSCYSGSGFPVQEFGEILSLHDGTLRRVLVPPFAVWSPDHVRIPHVLIAQRTLQELARTAAEWRVDLHIFANRLLSDIQRLRNRKSLRVTRLMETVFLTRDTARALADDAAARAGGFAHVRRFSPLIQDIGNPLIARSILERVWTLWGGDEPHTAVHYARHLLYEHPSEVDRAIEIAESAMETEAGARDSAVIHVVGTCYRFRMERRLDEARKSLPAGRLEIDDAVRRDFDTALLRFREALDLEESEYGHISSVQTIAKLLTVGRELAGAKTLSDFLTNGRRWCLDALARAEEHIAALRQVPSRQLSPRAQRVVAEWDLVYGNVDSVVSKLRILSKRHEDSEIRRALCSAIVSKHKRDWRRISGAELQEIAELSERNVLSQGVRDSDVRIWLRAYRHLPQFDIDRAVQRMADWHNLRPNAAEPPFYLSMLYFIKWLNSDRRIGGYAVESNEWLTVAARNRGIGSRGWGYEWLTGSRDTEYSAIHFDEIEADPAHTVRFGSLAERTHLRSYLARVEGIVRGYRGPQQADLDLGSGIMIRFTPREEVHRDDEGKTANLFVSFAYDARMGWDVALGRLQAG